MYVCAQGRTHIYIHIVHVLTLTMSCCAFAEDETVFRTEEMRIVKVL